MLVAPQFLLTTVAMENLLSVEFDKAEKAGKNKIDFSMASLPEVQHVLLGREPPSRRIQPCAFLPEVIQPVFVKMIRVLSSLAQLLVPSYGEMGPLRSLLRWGYIMMYIYILFIHSGYILDI